MQVKIRQSKAMSKFTERMFFFIFAPMSFIWFFIQSLNYDCSSAQTIGCEMAVISAPFIVAFLVASIGLTIRHRRIKKEKQTKHTDN